IAGEPGIGTNDCVGPPFEPSGPSIGSVSNRSLPTQPVLVPVTPIILLPCDWIPPAELVMSGDAAVPSFPATIVLRMKKLTFVLPRWIPPPLLSDEFPENVEFVIIAPIVPLDCIPPPLPEGALLFANVEL